MKHFLMPLIAWFVCANLPAQTMERQVIAAAGGFTQTTAGALDWTLGEPMITARTNGDLYWGEGFQQAWVAPLVPTTDAGTAPAISFTVYPNPAAQYLHVESDMPLLKAQLFDLTGRAVTEPIAVNGFARFSLNHLPGGFYLLRAFDATGRLAGVAKVQHIF